LAENSQALTKDSNKLAENNQPFFVYGMCRFGLSNIKNITAWFFLFNSS
jgi:hypothetical protein